MISDEGFTDEEVMECTSPCSSPVLYQPWMNELNAAQRQQLAYQLLSTLSKTQLADFHRNLAPNLKMDIIGSLPTELALGILSHLPYESLLTCALVCKKWQTLSNDQELWRRLCHARSWEWKTPRQDLVPTPSYLMDLDVDEGVGEEESDYPIDFSVVVGSSRNKIHDHDSGYVSMRPDTPPSFVHGLLHQAPLRQIGSNMSRIDRHHPSVHNRMRSTITSSPFINTDYKLLHQTHALLNSRMRNASFRMTVLPLPFRSPGMSRTVPQGHTSTIYCLALYTHPNTNQQYLLTGSRDCTILEWDLRIARPVRCFQGAHFGSVLNLAVTGRWMITGGSDGQVVVWDLIEGTVCTTRRDTEDSVLCVRASAQTVVACGKDRHLRIYKLPGLQLVHTLMAHRAAVNALSLSPDGLFVISASGDRSIRIWDTVTGNSVVSLEGWHSRGIASIDFHPPYIVSGSSDKHVRVFNLQTREGWSTCYDTARTPVRGLPDDLPMSLTSGTTSTPAPPRSKPLPTLSGLICPSCNGVGAIDKQPVGHQDLVRTVSMNHDYVVSGSYDETIKVWDRRTGTLLADLTGGHTGRVFGVVFDCTKIISCGEDQKICIWDLSSGLDTSFVKL